MVRKEIMNGLTAFKAIPADGKKGQYHLEFVVLYV
jgi:hypothetical protein